MAEALRKMTDEDQALLVAALLDGRVKQGRSPALFPYYVHDGSEVFAWLGCLNETEVLSFLKGGVEHWRTCVLRGSR